ncbi:MAG TPA: hypothetical protein VHM70_26755 [Polyangiaceae bacterium]|jgi:hypothetical protein|nr:hypothetical protein [Polyangiaceae bacterium]
MPHTPAVQHLLETEAARGLQARRVLGYPVWGIERYGWHERNLAQGLSSGEASEGQGEPKARRNLRIKESVRDLVSMAGLEQRDIWVLSSSQYRRKDAAGHERCMFTSFLEDALGDRLLFLERNVGAVSANPRDNVLFLDSLMEAIAASASVSARLLEHLIDQQTVRAFSPIPRKRLAKAAIMGQLWETVGTALVRKLQPKAVFVLCGYTRFVPLQRILKREGVPLIELQHGIVHNGHAGYSFDPASPPDYAPDHMLVFGERFGQALEECSGYWRGRWSVGGHPWLAERVRDSGAHPNPQGPVVFFSQPIEPVKRLLQSFLPEFRRLLPAEIEVVLKPHPREPDPSRDFKAAIDLGVKLDPLLGDSYRRLAQCRASVCVFSTLALEALAFPCPSIVLRSPLWPPDIQVLVDSGDLLAADTPEQLVKLISELSTSAERSRLAASLFGIGVEPPNFKALIQRLRQAS